MTQDRDFKRVVRARMARTGETYTAARAAVEQRAPEVGEPQDSAFDAARREQERLVARLFKDGRLEQIPARRKNRAGALLEVLTRFEPGRAYSEPEVNEVLLGVHPDFAYLRRELVNYHYLEREDGRYRVAGQAPERTTMQLQEIPAWEAAWLPGFLADTKA
ncbi:MAG: DUF2087 domain-containing protein [Nocardioides sp.]